MKNKTSVILTPILFAIVLVLGIYLGKLINTNTIQNTRSIIYPQTDKLHTVLNYIQKEYVDSVDMDKLIEKTLPLLLEQLDPHSVYIPAKNMEEANEPIEGNFEGIGVMFNIQKDTVVVINTISKGPSERVGVKAGDRIVKVNDSLFVGKKINNRLVVKTLKGPSGTEVKISVKRRGFPDLLNFDIKRDRIPVKSVDVAYIIAPKTAYIKISKFSMTTYNEFKKAIIKLKAQGVNAWILDLRGNGGGIMQAAVNIADEFLDAGKLIVYTKGKARARKDIIADDRGLCKKDKLVVLIDEWSASASEILAGALQDNDRGEIVGRRSFGKGLVQEPTFFPDNSGLRLTIARYYTPTGRCIQKSYGKDLEDYYMDLNKRYKHGEFTQADSIHFNDSLKFVTKGGKVVYGGGGIMPDYFVPVDTSGNSNYLKKIVARGLIYKFAFQYVDQHRKQLSEYKNYKTLNKHLLEEHIWSQFVNFAKNNGVPRDDRGIKKSKDLIENYLLAYINRNVLDDDGFYPTLLLRDKTVKKALEVLKTEKIK